MADEDSASRSQRRTRSQAAPEWAEVEELVLVNEVAAVEADFKTELSSFQKWKIIAENCAAQDVNRGLSQYSRKWDSLLDDYCRVAEFESNPSKTSYWSLGSHRRETLGLPVTFSEEVFSAIRSLLGARESQPDSEPENDAGAAKNHVVEIARDLGAYTGASDTHIYKHAKGSRKKRQRLSPHGTCSWKSPFEDNVSESSKPKVITTNRSAEEKSPQPSEPPSKKSPTENPPEEIPQSNPTGTEVEEPKQGSTENGPQTNEQTEEARERNIAQLLRRNAKRINVIVAEDGLDTEDLLSDEVLDKCGELVRRRGTEIMFCLAAIVKTLDQLYDSSQE